MTSQTQLSKKLIRSLHLKVQEIEDERAGLINSMESFVNKPIQDVALAFESGELSTEQFQEMSSYLDYVLSTLVEIDLQIQKPYSTSSVPQVTDLVDKVSQKLSMELSNSFAQRDERFKNLEMQAEKMSQDSSYLITQWEEKEKKIHTSINHLVQKTDDLSSNVTNQVNEQTKNIDALKLKICDLESQAEKNNCQFSSVACEINGLRESCEGHGYQLINLQRQIKTLGRQELLSESLTTILESVEKPDSESNLQAEARLQNTNSIPAAAGKIQSSKTPLPEKGDTLQDPDHVKKSKAISSTVSKDKKTSSQEQNKEKDIDNKFNTTKQQQPEIFKPQPTQGYSTYPAMHLNDGSPNPGIPQATAPMRPPQARGRRIINITDPESGRNITDEIINNRQHSVDSEEHNEDMPAVYPSNQEICKIFTRLIADRLKSPEETNSVSHTQKVGASSASVQSSQYQQPPPRQVQQANPAHATVIHPNMSHMMRPDLTQPPPQIGQSTSAPLYNPQHVPTLHAPRMNQLQQPLRPQMPQISGVQQTAPVVQHQVPLVSQTPSAPHVPQPFSSGQVADFVPLAAKLEASAPIVDKVNPTTEATPKPILKIRPSKTREEQMKGITDSDAGLIIKDERINNRQLTVDKKEDRGDNKPPYFISTPAQPGLRPRQQQMAPQPAMVYIQQYNQGNNVVIPNMAHPIKTLLAEVKTNLSSDVTSQILETRDRSLKKAMKSQASHRSVQTNRVYKKPLLTFDNDKSKLLELRFCLEALKKPTGLPDLEIVRDEPNIGPQQQKRKAKPEFPESFFEQPSERWMEQGYIDLKKL